MVLLLLSMLAAYHLPVVLAAYIPVECIIQEVLYLYWLIALGAFLVYFIFRFSYKITKRKAI